MSNQDPGDRKPFGRSAQFMSKSSDRKSEESGYRTPQEISGDDKAPSVTGRGRFFAMAVSFCYGVFLLYLFTIFFASFTMGKFRSNWWLKKSFFCCRKRQRQRNRHRALRRQPWVAASFWRCYKSLHRTPKPILVENRLHPENANCYRPPSATNQVDQQVSWKKQFLLCVVFWRTFCFFIELIRQIKRIWTISFYFVSGGRGKFFAMLKTVCIHFAYFFLVVLRFTQRQSCPIFVSLAFYIKIMLLKTNRNKSKQVVHSVEYNNNDKYRCIWDCSCLHILGTVKSETNHYITQQSNSFLP